MAFLCRYIKQIGKSLITFEPTRNISLSATTCLREITEKKENNVLTIEAHYVPHKKEHLQLKLDSKACSLCATKLNVKHTDVLILSQFLRSDGCMLPRRVTRLCDVQQKRVTALVAMAQKAGLMPNLTPKSSKKNPKRRRDWKKFNMYFDEKTIKNRYRNY
ncbi:28S ribosomal protein S18a, mitochondrial [Camponotus floridanus]|uniref:28S ribosomal protein S18a, mitochondrial n=1 Tax=Camponotus floridanus TaxID=104421 RepID=E2ALL9_CAMFO|nr:28S ribosomal protein S18a, mitochondrial [Camponotus floridanus]EFN65628.1 28S ribosomal protein S18a, mitochondrial [Camponotus floridanus]